jgi:CubicO group peptidase (beta-lactamase class C family)
MDQVVQSYVSDKKFMGSVLVARGGEVLLSRGYGSANLEARIRIEDWDS